MLSIVLVWEMLLKCICCRKPNIPKISELTHHLQLTMITSHSKSTFSSLCWSWTSVGQCVFLTGREGSPRPDWTIREERLLWWDGVARETGRPWCQRTTCEYHHHTIHNTRTHHHAIFFFHDYDGVHGDNISILLYTLSKKGFFICPCTETLCVTVPLFVKCNYNSK